MEPVNWCRDIPAESVMESIGIRWIEEIVLMKSIDFAASSRNFARDDARLDLEHAECIANGRRAGKPIPYVVLRKMPTGGKYVIAGGNHRCKALKDCSDVSVMAYVVDCTNAEFSILCKALNAVVGKGSDKRLRVKQAMQSVVDGTLTPTEAAKIFNVSTNAINTEIRSQKGMLRIEAAAPGKSKTIPKAIGEALSTVPSESIVKASVDAYLTGAKTEDVVKAIRSAATKTTDEESLKEIQKVTQLVPVTKVASKKKTDFLRCLTSMERLFDKHNPSSTADLDIETTLAKEVKERCKKLANTLNSL